MNPDAKECDMCCEKFTFLNKQAKVSCCDVVVCVGCVKRYLLGTIKDAHCMGCKKPLDIQYIVKNLGKSFVWGDYRYHKENVLFDREQALLPDTMHVVEQEKQFEKIEKVRKEHREKANNLYVEISAIREAKDLDECIKLAELTSRQAYHLAMVKNIERFTKSFKEPAKERKQFVKACPVDGCKGFLSSAYKCGLCETFTCAKCFAIIGKERNDEKNPHICNEDDVKSAEIIKKETKTCRCGTVIFKISGCDQMFCTQCHVAFSWKTGEIETGKVHNPHYYAYLRENGRDVPRDPQDGCIDGEQDIDGYKISKRENPFIKTLFPSKTTKKIIHFLMYSNSIMMLLCNTIHIGQKMYLRQILIFVNSI